jgi:hypothetical protein
MLRPLVVLGLLAAGVQATTPDFVLDVGSFAPAAQQPSTGQVQLMVSGGGSSATPVPAPNVRVSLATLDRSSYVTGEALVYEVLIQNVGDKPFVLPWSPDLNWCTRQDRAKRSGYREALISLRVIDPVTGRSLAEIDSQPLVGSPDVEGSLQVLQPKQTAMVRVPAHWRFSSEREMKAALRDNVGPTAVIAVLRVLGYQPVTSNAPQEITLVDGLKP